MKGSSSHIDWSLQLPTDLTIHVFQYLDEQTLCRLATVCRTWRQLAMYPSLWYDICRRTQANLNPDRALHWKDKFKERVAYRKRFLTRKLACRYVFLVLASSICLSLALYALTQLHTQHRRLTKYDEAQGNITNIDIVQHQNTNEDSEEFSYEFILHYSYRDRSGNEWLSWNLWPLPSANYEYSTRTEAIAAARELGDIGDKIQVYVDWTEHPPYSYLFRQAVFEPYFYLLLSLTFLCIVALVDAMSYSVLKINPDTTDLKAFVACLGRYMYPILDNHLDNTRVRRLQGVALSIAAALFHILGFTSVFYYLHYSGDSTVLWVFLLIAEPIALYTAYQGWKHILDCRFQPLLFCDQRPYLLLGTPNMLHVIFQTEKRFFVRRVILITSLVGVDEEVMTIPGEVNRTRIVYTLLYEQDFICGSCVNEWIDPGEHYIDNVQVLLPNHLQESTLNPIGFPRYVWRLTINVSGNGPLFSKRLVVLVQQVPTVNNH